MNSVERILHQGGLPYDVIHMYIMPLIWADDRKIHQQKFRKLKQEVQDAYVTHIAKVIDVTYLCEWKLPKMKNRLKRKEDIHLLNKILYLSGLPKEQKEKMVLLLYEKLGKSHKYREIFIVELWAYRQRAKLYQELQILSDQLYYPTTKKERHERRKRLTYNSLFVASAEKQSFQKDVLCSGFNDKFLKICERNGIP